MRNRFSFFLFKPRNSQSFRKDHSLTFHKIDRNSLIYIKSKGKNRKETLSIREPRQS
jgi:hypothetical protein